jgi:hypothetical protein
MKNRYPILAAALALGEFSLQDLQERTGLPPASIDSVIRRDSRFEPLRRGKAGPRGGGQPVIYRIRESEVEGITAELRELFTAIVAAGAMNNSEGTSVPSLPDTYAAAVELIEAATKGELSPSGRRVLLEMALPNLRAAGRQLGRDGSQFSKQRLAILQGLVHAVNEAIQSPQQPLRAVQAHLQQMAESSEKGTVRVEQDKLTTLAQVVTAEPEWSRSASPGSILDPDPRVETLMWFRMAQGRN